jgi:hypothetical protein
MFLSQLKTIGASLLVVTACATGVGVLAQQPADRARDHRPSPLETHIKIEQRRMLRVETQDKTTERLEKLGARIERDVVIVNLVATKVTDDDLASLSTYPNLRSLHLHHTGISDAGLQHLEGLNSLTTLDVFDTQVTDAGLEHLADWVPYLQRLELSDTNITDAGLKSLERLRDLQHLDVRDTKVTKAGVEELQRVLPRLRIQHGSHAAH